VGTYCIQVRVANFLHFLTALLHEQDCGV